VQPQHAALIGLEEAEHGRPGIPNAARGIDLEIIDHPAVSAGNGVPVRTVELHQAVRCAYINQTIRVHPHGADLRGRGIVVLEDMHEGHAGEIRHRGRRRFRGGRERGARAREKQDEAGEFPHGPEIGRHG
jgi:hypothetical protein